MIVRLALALSLALAAGARAETLKIPWEEAGKNVGKEAIVEGRVLGVHCSQLACLLAFEPSFNGFTAVIQAENFKMFPPSELDQRFSGRKVRVRGKIVERDGKPEIVVDNPEGLVLGDARERREMRETDRVRSQTEVLDRLADILDRITDLTERMAATQERMETMLAAMEQREAQLEAAYQPPQPAPPPPTGYGDAQPRPAYERLRTLKRGMTAAEVQRLVGPPQYVEQAAGGGETWYYGFGRSVSFDGRGRAQGMIGFAAP